jgi:uncharacterized protein (TIGR00730 family)
MGALADAALAAGGEVIGVMPQMLVDKEAAHRHLPDLRVVRSMHERKALMAELSNAFIALPGGFGTLEEFFEMVTWAQLGVHRKPCGLLNVEGYYEPMLRLLDHAVAERFLKAGNRDLILSEPCVETLLERMASFNAPSLDKWIGRAET